MLVSLRFQSADIEPSLASLAKWDIRESGGQHTVFLDSCNANFLTVESDRALDTRNEPVNTSSLPLQTGSARDGEQTDNLYQRACYRNRLGAGYASVVRTFGRAAAARPALRMRTRTVRLVLCAAEWRRN